MLVVKEDVELMDVKTLRRKVVLRKGERFSKGGTVSPTYFSALGLGDVQPTFLENVI